MSTDIAAKTAMPTGSAIALLLSFTIAQAQMTQPTSAYVASCGYQEFKETGTVTFQADCPIDMMPAIIEAARKHRTVNAGDIDAITSRLDHVIQLLEPHNAH